MKKTPNVDLWSLHTSTNMHLYNIQQAEEGWEESLDNLLRLRISCLGVDFLLLLFDRVSLCMPSCPGLVL